MKKKQKIIALALIILWFLAALPALYAEVQVVYFSPAFLRMDYSEKKGVVGGDIYYLGQKADSTLPAKASLLFVNLSRESSVSYNSQMLMYSVAPRSVREVRSLGALRALRINDYDYILFHSFKVADAFAFTGSYPGLDTIYSNRAKSGLYAIYLPGKRGEE